VPSGTGTGTVGRVQWALATGAQRLLGANSDTASCHDATFRSRGGAEHGAAVREREARQGRPARAASEQALAVARARCSGQWPAGTAWTDDGPIGDEEPVKHGAPAAMDARLMDGWMDGHVRADADAAVLCASVSSG
jgi:hypothetical protein